MRRVSGTLSEVRHLLSGILPSAPARGRTTENRPAMDGLDMIGALGAATIAGLSARQLPGTTTIIMPAWHPLRRRPT